MSNNINPSEINDIINQGGFGLKPSVTKVGKKLTLIDPSSVLEGQTVDQSDLFIFANLKARIKNKSFVTKTEEEEISISFLKNKDTELGSINSDFLTTNWTEIGNKTPELNRDLETFGIENIDISINAGFIPSVTIDFVDLRGATLFEQGSCSPYAAFFSQPYPIFELTVKGYYGYPIKYYLAIKSFNTSFDASSGNYKSKAEFIGYSYAFLSDILLGYVMAAPYMDGAKNKLKNIYRKYDDLYQEMGYNVGGNPFDLQQMQDNPMTLFEYFNKIEELKTGKGSADSILTKIGNSTNIAELDQIGKLEDILNTSINEEVTALKKNVLGDDYTEESDEKLVFTYNSTDNDYYNNVFLPNLTDWRSIFNEIKDEYFSNNDNVTTLQDLEEKIKVTSSNSGTKVDLTEFDKYIKNKLSETRKEVEVIKEKTSKAINETIKSSIGFIPTIRSFFTVLIANTELFLELLKDASFKAEEYHDESEDKIRFNGLSRDVKEVYYAWPTYNEEDNVKSNSGSNFVEKYPGIKFPLWPEVKFVEDFYLALEQLQIKLDQSENDEIDLSKYEDVPGRDNYMAINAMETPVGSLDTHNSYFNLSDLTEITKTIGERFILTTNVSSLNEVNLSQSVIRNADIVWSDLINDGVLKTKRIYEDALDNNAFFRSNLPILQTTFLQNPYYNFNLTIRPTDWETDDPYLSNFKNTFDTSYVVNKDNFNQINGNTYYLGQVDAHNLVDTFKENEKILQIIVNNFNDKDRLKEEVIEKLGVTKKGNQWRYEGKIELNSNSGDKKTFKPNIHEMEGKDLFRIQQDDTSKILYRFDNNLLKKDKKVYFDIIDGSTTAKALNAFNRDFGIETASKLDTTELQEEEIPVYAPIAFSELVRNGAIFNNQENENKQPSNQFSIAANRFNNSNISSFYSISTNMLFSPWNGAYSTINYGNDLTTNQNGDFTKLSNFTSQSNFIIQTRPILETYPDYIFPYRLAGFRDVIKAESVDEFNDFPFRFRENGAIEFTGYGMYNRLPTPFADGVKFNYEGGAWYWDDDQNEFAIQYSAPYKKPFNIDLKLEDDVKTLDDLLSLKGISAATGDGIDYIDFGSEQRLNTGLDTVMDQLIDKGLLVEDEREVLTGIQSRTAATSEIKPLVNSINQQVNLTKYLAGPDDEDNKLKWFVVYKTIKYEEGGVTKSFSLTNVLATSNQYSFSNFFNIINNGFPPSNPIYFNDVVLPEEKIDDDDAIVTGIGQMTFYILGDIIKPKTKNGVITEDLDVIRPKQDFYNKENDYEEKTIKKGPISGTLIDELNQNFGLTNVGNQLNAGNTIVETPFWRHNFPDPELNSNIGKTNEGDNNTVYYSYWGGKYYLYGNNKAGTHLPLGIRVDLDSWDNTSELIKGANTDFYTGVGDDHRLTKGKKYILTQHNKDGFGIEKGAYTEWDEDDNHKGYSNYNRSKNWKGSLAYLWLANHFHRPWSGTYTNTNRHYGPLQTLGSASIVASIPKATLLLLGAVLWRMRESGLLISDEDKWNLEPSENAIQDNEDNYLDPINIPILPKEISYSNEDMVFNTQYFGFENNKDVENDIKNETHDYWNNGVRPPMASLFGFGSWYSKDDDREDPEQIVKNGAIVSCFPRADEWPALNLGMTYCYDFFESEGLTNPFKNQYKILTPFFYNNGALMQRYPNQAAVWLTREDQLEKFKTRLNEALKYTQKYLEGYEANAQKDGEEEAQKEIDKTKGETEEAVNKIGVLEDFFADNPRFGGADESYTKLTILQHDLNRLKSRGELNDTKNKTDYGRSRGRRTKSEDNEFTGLKKNIGTDYLRGYIPIGPELWFLPRSVKSILIELFEEYVGDFNNFEGNADGTSGSDFDKVLATIDPLNFPNPKGGGITDRKYPNVLKGDMAPIGLKSIEDGDNYNLPQIDRHSSGSLGYPEPLKKWEKIYTNTESKNPRPSFSATISQIPQKKESEKKSPYNTSNGDTIIDVKSFFPTTFNIPPDDGEPNPAIDLSYNQEIRGEYVVANATPRIWWGEFANDGEKEVDQKYFYFTDEEFDSYLDGFAEIIKSKKVDNLSKNLLKGGLNSEINNQDNDIKLSLYRSLQSIYNKWISSIESGDDDNSNRLFYNPIGTADEDRLLIDHFSFVNRINSDIGNKAVVNLETVLTLKKNIQNSIFGVTSDVLDTSNFAFHPLPAYVDLSSGLSKLTKVQNATGGYQNNVIANMFIPQTTSDAFNYASGPHYLCMYVGGNSKALDLSRNKESEACLKLGGKGELAGDSGSIEDTIGSDDDENSAGVVGFKVKFGDQNQNHFISVDLDQAEYKNTNESLRAIEMISRAQQGDGSGGPVFKSQSLYDVFLNRSYSCTVESFGNMMIQPLQYFELENVPMFYGSYLIRDIKHNIKPHDVKTTFVGDRIPQTTVPIIEDVIALYEIPKGDGSAGSLSTSKGTGSSKLGDSLDTVINDSGGLYVKNSSGNVYIVNSGNGLAGKFLRQIIKDYEEFRTEKYPNKNWSFGFNGVTRSLQETVKGGANRSRTSLHAAGLAIDVQFIGTFTQENGSEVTLGDAYNKQGSFPGEKRYGYSSGNYTAVQDTEFVKSIYEFITEVEPWKSQVTWGATFYGWCKDPSKCKNIPGIPIRKLTSRSDYKDFNIAVNEFHHFEIKSSYIESYWKPYKGTLEKFGLPYPPLKSSEREKVYEYPFENLGPTSNDTPQDGDAVAGNTNIDSNLQKELNGPSTQAVDYGINDYQLFTYLAWQQGASGAAQHYSLWKNNGKITKYTIKVQNIKANWPSNYTAKNGVSKNDVDKLYNDGKNDNNNHNKLAAAFVDVQRQLYSNKLDSGTQLINSNGSNRSDIPYSEIKEAFEKHQDPPVVDFNNLVAFGMIENALNTDTEKGKKFKTMFQMNSTSNTYKSVFDKLDSVESKYSDDFEDWKNIDVLTAAAVPKMISVFSQFEKRSGFT